MPEDTIASMVYSTFRSVRLMPESQEFQPIGGGVEGSAGTSWREDVHPACAATRLRAAMIDGSGKRTGRTLPMAPGRMLGALRHLGGRPVLRRRNRVGHD